MKNTDFEKKRHEYFDEEMPPALKKSLSLKFYTEQQKQSLFDNLKNARIRIDGVKIFNKQGFDKDGFNSMGRNVNGIHRYTGTAFDNKGYDQRGFNEIGMHRITMSKYDQDGFDMKGRNIKGVHKDTGNKFNKEGFDKDGFNELGIHASKVKKSSQIPSTERFSPNFDIYNKKGFNNAGIHRDTGNKFNKEGFDKDGFNQEGYNKKGFDRTNMSKTERDKKNRQQNNTNYMKNIIANLVGNGDINNIDFFAYNLSGNEVSKSNFSNVSNNNISYELKSYDLITGSYNYFKQNDLHPVILSCDISEKRLCVYLPTFDVSVIISNTYGLGTIVLSKKVESKDLQSLTQESLIQRYNGDMKNMRINFLNGDEDIENKQRYIELFFSRLMDKIRTISTK